MTDAELQKYREHLATHKVLVADDEPFYLGKAVGIAEANGFSVKFVDAAHKAWRELSDNPGLYSILITDNTMRTTEEPDDGYDYRPTDTLIPNQGLELVRRIRKHPEFDNLEIVVFSGLSTIRDAVSDLRATFIGKNSYLLNRYLRERSEL
tara:strand:+ start:867 stop:1319 length:453 start_codon:yes stop_codon:yes gene_type:complete